jgi:hypothetical protein
MFKIGQQVICIDDALKPGRKLPPNFKFVKKNQIYTIREIYIPKTNSDMVALIFEEITNDVIPNLNHELGFDSDRFRPIDTLDDSKKWADSVLQEIEESFLVGLTES